MSFRTSLSRMEGEHPLVESSGKLGKGFGIACQSVAMVRKRIQPEL
jgi:hypothetical protein